MSASDEVVLLHWLDEVYGWVQVLAILLGITLNSLTLQYFYNRKHQLSNLLFFLIAVNDLVILIACIPSAVSLLSNRKAVLFGPQAVCILAGFSFNLASRMSVFLIALLALARSLCLLSPFRMARKRIYLIPLAIYFALNITLASLPLIFSKKLYHYWPLGAHCSWGVNELSFVGTNYTASWKVMTYGSIIVPWFIPGIIVLVSSVLSLKALFKSGRRIRQISRECSGISSVSVTQENKSLPNMKSVNHATITIAITSCSMCLAG